MQGKSPITHNAKDRLESWKAIASHLNRSVRTVRRWEQSEGLPVHRHRHERGSTVFAYRSELDAWRSAGESRAAMPEAEEAVPIVEVVAEPPTATSDEAVTSVPAARSSLRLAAPVAATLALLAVVLLGIQLAQTPPVDHSTALHGEDLSWVIIAAPFDETGADAYGDSLVRVLKNQISNEPALAVVPTARVAEALALMRRDTSTLPDATLAREIAVRDGQVHALLVPQATRIGDTLLLDIEIRAVANGVELMSLSRVTQRDEHVVATMNDLAAEASRAVASLAPPRADAPSLLPRVTTVSEEALRLYARAVELTDCGHPEPAIELLREAVSQDPEFASAWIELARAQWQTGVPGESALPAADRAVALLSQISPMERYLVRGVYHQLTGDLDEAVSSMDALYSITDNDPHANRVAVEICLLRDGEANCVDRRLRLARSAPNDFAANVDAAWALAMWQPGHADFDELVRRARASLASDSASFDPVRFARSRMLPALDLWRRGAIAESLVLAKEAGRDIEELPLRARDELAEMLGKLDLAAGRIALAGNRFELITNAPRRAELQALALFAAGDKEAMRGHLEAHSSFKRPFTALLLSMSGMSQEAGDVLKDLEANNADPIALQVLRGRLAMADGNIAEGLGFLRDAASQPLTIADVRLAGFDMLAMALASKGEFVAAASVLENTRALAAPAAINGDGVLWVMCQKQLASIYRQAGRVDAAVAIEEDLVQRLRFADSGHPVLRALRPDTPEA